MLGVMRGMAGIGVAAALLLGGCDKAATPGGQASAPAVNMAEPAPAPTPTPIDPPEPPKTDLWIGKWVGVEGLALDIAAGDRPGTYKLNVALMDSTNDYIGTAAGDTIRFERDGATETIRHTDGAETGLKWLAEKKDCLTIKPGEGFCRD